MNFKVGMNPPRTGYIARSWLTYLSNERVVQLPTSYREMTDLEVLDLAKKIYWHLTIVPSLPLPEGLKV